MRINKIKIGLSFLLAIIFIASILSIPQVQAANLSGRILLQVESHGEAWYVNPQDGARYYLGRPHDAYVLMRALGLGASNKDIRNFLITSAPSRLSGRILLQVEEQGQSYYVNPLNLKLYYLGRPSDAFNLMRQQGLGISNEDIASIPVGSIVEPSKTSIDSDVVRRDFSFKYKNIDQGLSLNLRSSLYNLYKTSTKVLSYRLDSAPKDPRASFYELFLKSKTADSSISELVSVFEQMAASNNWSDDELVELVLAFIQYIPYDEMKAKSSSPEPYYPYETLYLNKGVCSDKTFLAYQILDEMGYGVAIIDMPDINHSAIGIACEKKYSLENSGYCYAETTNYFPITVIPKEVDSGRADNASHDFSNLFSSQRLGNIEIRNKKYGRQYLGASLVHAQANELNSVYADLLNTKLGPNRTYLQVIEYNKKVDLFNQLLSSFYQY